MVQSLSVSLALVLCGAVLGAALHHPVITGEDEMDFICATRNPQMNISLTCTATEGSVLWLLGDYTMVDRDQFLNNYGVLIEGDVANETELTLRVHPPAVNFIFDSLEAKMIDVTCQVVTDEINTVRSNRTVNIYQDFPPVDQPSVTVTSCNDDRTLTVSLQYTVVDDGDICSDDKSLSYSLTLSDGDTPDRTDNKDQVYEVKVAADSVGGLRATMTVCNTNLCRDTLTDLSDLTCNSAFVGRCECSATDNDCLHAVYSVVRCNFTKASSKWDCRLTGDGRVEDVFDGIALNKTRIPLFQDSCPSGSPRPRSTCCICDLLEEWLTAALVSLVAGGIIGLILGIIIIKYCCKPPMITEELDKVPMEARKPKELTADN